MPHVTFFKGDRPSATVQRRLRKIERDNKEEAAKRRVRLRDKSCRFPLCGCRKLGLPLEVSHNEHKGIGGNPAGNRSDDKLLMLLCRQRHQLAPFSIHQGTVSWAPLTKQGANGPVLWQVDLGYFGYRSGGWGLNRFSKVKEVARETAVGVVVVDERYRAILEELAGMEL